MAAGGERILTQRELNRALLARQLLLERVALPLPRVVERLGGIQNQYAPNAYIRLWSCVEGFRRADLTRALEQRSLVQGTLLRATIHVVSRRDYWSFAVGVRAAQRDWWLRVQRPRPDERRIEATATELRRLLADGPRRREELQKETGGGFGGCAIALVRDSHVQGVGSAIDAAFEERGWAPPSYLLAEASGAAAVDRLG